MWTSVDEPHQKGNLETIGKTIHKLSSDYLARAIK